MKKKALIIFKSKWDWNKFVISKISKFYEIEILYLDKIKKNYLNTISEVNEIITKNQIEVAFFDVDYQKFINFYFIKKIKNIKKVMMTFDNYERHNINSITACSCHVVLSDIISVLKYKELGIPAFNWFLESDGNFYKNLNLEKKIDVLFFGKVNKDRKNYINFIEKNGINIKIVGNNENSQVSDEDLVKLISEAKIVINFTKTTWNQISNYPENNLFKNQYQLKGRIVQAGLCGTACVSEYSPHHDLLFDKNEFLQFKNKHQCINILKDLLGNRHKLEAYTKNFSTKTKDFYEDSKSFEKVYEFLNNIDLKNLSITNKNLNKIPYWYKRICAKQILLRDHRLKKILSSLVNFKEVYYIAKKSNLITFLLIFLETITNFVYYGLINTIKSKSMGKKRYTDEL